MAQFGQNFEDKVGHLGIRAMEGVTRTTQQSRTTGSEDSGKFRTIEFPQAFLYLVWETSHG